MVEVDFDKILEYKDELITYDGFLPLLIRNVIMKKWCKHLLKNGLYDEIISECVTTKPHNYDDAISELDKWCKENKKYQGIIIK